ncbi:hypothetical protein V2J09_019474 [Rumex salicifolius]
MKTEEQNRAMEKSEEIATKDDKPQPNYRGIKAMPFIIGNETFEKLGTIGTSANLLIYLTSVFNMKSITATTLVNFFNGSTNLGTILGAFLCDTFFGRYKTLGFSTVASFIGLLIIALTAAVKQLHPAHCRSNALSCEGPSPWQMTFLLTGFGFLIIGAGGIRPCNLAFGVDQFNPNTESGKRGIDSFFNWYFFTFTFAEMISLTLIVYVQTNISWAIGLSIPAGLMLVSTILYFMGSRIYVKVKPQGSPLTSIVQVIVVAFKKRKLKLDEAPLFNYIPADSINAELPYTNQFRCLDKAAILTEEDELNSDGSPANQWRLCTVQQVEETKCLMRVIPIWAAASVYFVAITQQNTYAIFQASQSDRRFSRHTHFQIPAASYIVFLMLGLTIWIPIYDRIIVPVLRRITGKEAGGITILQRMGTGMVLSIICMLVSGVVEKKRRTIALNSHQTLGIAPRKGAISPMSAMWLVPQLTLAGLAEAFMAVAEVEFFYKQFPENMKSLGGSLFYCGMAVGSYLSNFMVSIVHSATTGKDDEGDWLAEDLNKGRLDLYYYVVAGLGFVNLGYFLVCARWYRYRGSVEDEDKAVVVKPGKIDNVNGAGFEHQNGSSSV